MGVSRPSALGGVLYAQSSWRAHPDTTLEAIFALLGATERAASVLVVDPVQGACSNVGPFSEDALGHALQLDGVAGIAIEGHGLRVGLELGNDDGGPPHIFFAVDCPTNEGAIIAAFRTAAEQLPVLHGGLDLYASHAEAVGDLTLVPQCLPRPELRLRWAHDSQRRRHLWTHLRRLFPLTIIGAPLRSSSDEAAALEAGAILVEQWSEHLAIRATPSITGLLDASWRVACAPLASWLWPRTLRGPSDAPLALGRQIRAPRRAPTPRSSSTL